MATLETNFLTGSSNLGKKENIPLLQVRAHLLRRSCDTRDVVLKRDGTNVVQSSSGCTTTSGTWVSPYDGATWSASSDIDIDHLVPLSNAWKVGISSN